MGKKQRTIGIKKSYFFVLCFVLLPISLITFVYFITQGISLPYVGYNAWNFNIYSLIAHNYNQFGFFATRFAPIISVSRTYPISPEYYLHHPPLLSIFQAIIFFFLGESFWSGRLTVILFSCLSLILIYLIGKKLIDISYGVISLIIATVSPAFVLFGRMIGQEALVLFFSLFTLYQILQYLETRKKIYLFFVLIGIILGVLSDWPMIYFILALSPWLLYRNEKKILLVLISTAVTTGIIFIFYIIWILGGIKDLLFALQARSLGQVTTLSFWPLRWFGAIFIRIFFYNSPLIVIVSTIISLGLLRKRKLDELTILLSSFFLFGFLHIIFYPEGSFGHPYWIIYFLPFFIFSSGMGITYLLRKRYVTTLVLFFFISLLYCWKIESWKTKEIQGNLWRYDLANKINQYIQPYATLFLEDSVPIDYDMFLYQFHHQTRVVSSNKNIEKNQTAHYYIGVCNRECQNLHELIQHFTHKSLDTTIGKIYIIDLYRPLENLTDQIVIPNSQKVVISRLPNKNSYIKNLYSRVISLLHVPQL